MGKILVFGGHDGSSMKITNFVGESMLNDLHVLDIDEMTWFQPHSENPTIEYLLPPPRVGHSSTLIGSHKLFIFGGGNGYRTLNDSWYLDTNTYHFSRANPKGQPPPARAGHSGCYADSHVVLFGGGTLRGQFFRDVRILNMGMLVSVLLTLSCR
jgi:hypothetical protein